MKRVTWRMMLVQSITNLCALTSHSVGKQVRQIVGLWRAGLKISPVFIVPDKGVYTASASYAVSSIGKRVSASTTMSLNHLFIAKIIGVATDLLFTTTASLWLSAFWPILLVIISCWLKQLDRQIYRQARSGASVMVASSGSLPPSLQVGTHSLMLIRGKVHEISVIDCKYAWLCMENSHFRSVGTQSDAATLAGAIGFPMRLINAADVILAPNFDRWISRCRQAY